MFTMEILGDCCELVNKDYFTKESDEENSNIGLINSLTCEKLIGLYFSAGWCPPCRKFTPVLCDFYEEAMNRNTPFEVIFVSFDKSADDMKTYFTESHGDWMAVKFGDPSIEMLKTTYHIDCIPKLVIVNSHGNVISDRGRKEVQDRGVTCLRGWMNSPLMNRST